MLVVMTGWKTEGSGCLGVPLRLDKRCVCACICAGVGCVRTRAWASTWVCVLGSRQAHRTSPGSPYPPSGPYPGHRPQVACPLYDRTGLSPFPWPTLGLGLISCPYLPSKQLHSNPQ